MGECWGGVWGVRMGDLGSVVLGWGRWGSVVMECGALGWEVWGV